MTTSLEIRKLNTLRALAALIVLISHFSNRSGLWGGMLGNGAGQFGVMLFFMLSAFLMAYLYFDIPPTRQSIANYALARVARIVPLFLLIVMLSFIFKRYVPDPFSEFVFNIPDVNALMSHLLLLYGDRSLWTIQPEIHFYILFGVAWFLRPYFPRSLLAIVIALMVLSFVYVGNATFDETIFGLKANFHIFKTYPYFAVGFLFGYLFRRWQPPARLRSHYFVASLLIIPLFYPVIFFRLTGHHIDLWSNAGVLACVSFVFFAIVFLVPTGNKILENRGGDMLGKISYSLYLLHLPLLLALKSLGLVSGLSGLVLFLALAMSLAYVSFVFFESPARNWIRSELPPKFRLPRLARRTQ